MKSATREPSKKTASALTRDVPQGVSAAYLLKSRSKLAALYNNDPGLLERHHSVRAFELLACGDSGPLQGMAVAERLEVCGAVRDVIMATDMRHHGRHCDALRERSGRSPAGAGGGGGEDAEAVGLEEMQLLLKCADISNSIRPMGEAREWAARATEEMFEQGDLERASGLEVTGTCDRRTQSRVGLQAGFVDGVVGPLLRGMAGRYPGLGGLVAQLEENRREWGVCTDEGLLREVAAIEERRRRVAVEGSVLVGVGRPQRVADLKKRTGPQAGNRSTEWIERRRSA